MKFHDFGNSREFEPNWCNKRRIFVIFIEEVDDACRVAIGSQVPSPDSTSSNKLFIGFCIFLVLKMVRLRPLIFNHQNTIKNSTVIYFVSGWDGRTDKSCQKLQQRRRKTVGRQTQLFLPQLYFTNRSGPCPAFSGWCCGQVHIPHECVMNFRMNFETPRVVMMTLG